MTKECNRLPTTRRSCLVFIISSDVEVLFYSKPLQYFLEYCWGRLNDDGIPVCSYVVISCFLIIYIGETQNHKKKSLTTDYNRFETCHTRDSYFVIMVTFFSRLFNFFFKNWVIFIYAYV